MKTQSLSVIGIILLIHFPLMSMVIHNYIQKKDKSIRTETAKFDEDYLFLGNELNFSGEAEDLIFLGKRLIFKGKTKLGLIALCKDLIFSGSSDNGLMAAAMDITFDGNIKSNSYIGCRNFNMSDKSQIKGNLFIGCARLSLDGDLNGDLYAGANELIINNEINGNIFFSGRRIIFGEKGKINGNLNYSTREKLSEKEMSKVGGTITYNKKQKDRLPDSNRRPTNRMAGLFIRLALIISFVIVGSVLLILPVFRKLDENQTAKTFFNTALWGLIPLLIYPGIIALSLALIITIPFAFVLILSVIPLFFIANIIGTTLLGKFLVTTFKWKFKKRHFQFLIGALGVTLLSLIPIVNFLSFIFISALGYGVFISFLFQRRLAVSQ